MIHDLLNLADFLEHDFKSPKTNVCKKKLLKSHDWSVRGHQRSLPKRANL